MKNRLTLIIIALVVGTLSQAGAMRTLTEHDLDWVAHKLVDIQSEIDLYAELAVAADTRALLAGIQYELELVERFHSQLSASPTRPELERLTLALFEIERGLEEVSRQLGPTPSL